jgi:hypothetical protein
MTFPDWLTDSTVLNPKNPYLRRDHGASQHPSPEDASRMSGETFVIYLTTKDRISLRKSMKELQSPRIENNNEVP